MRDDRLGLRPIADMQGEAGRAGIETGDGDGCKSIRDRNARVVALRVMQAVNRHVTGLASMMAHGASIGMMTYIGRAWEGLTGCKATECVSRRQTCLGHVAGVHGGAGLSGIEAGDGDG